MAVDKAQFSESVISNLKANKEYTKFFINFTKDGKRINRVLDYTTKAWDKKTRTSKAMMELAELRDKANTSGTHFNENSTLDQVQEVYFQHAEKSLAWSKELQNMYRLHIQPSLGKKKIKDIRTVQIDEIRKHMQEKGHSKQTEKGCSPRTIKKVLAQTLKPILQYAADNKVLDTLPKITIPKQNKPKKTVTDAQNKFKLLFFVIMRLYKDDPFYRALFLFAWHGRRWNEIKTLEWDDIDFTKEQYTIRAKHNKIGETQTYSLLPIMKDALLAIMNDHIGIVFKSPKTKNKLSTPKRQLGKIKQITSISELTMHYFRHIAVSAFGEAGVSNTILSAALGHTNLQTVNDYYLSVNHTKSSEQVNAVIQQLLLENKEI